LEEDDAALKEIEAWREAAARPGLALSDVEEALLNNRIRQRSEAVRKAYDAFLGKNPRHTNARVAYAAFLDEVGDEEAAGAQLEKAVAGDPTNAPALNNLANHHGHNGQVRKSFDLYERALKLAPNEPLYCENLATTVFLFRKDAMAHYGITEQQVFTKALGLYRRAHELDPGNFDRAVEWAKSYYGVRLPDPGDAEARRRASIKLGEEAMEAWGKAFKAASSDAEREGVRLHFARWHINAGRLTEAERELNSVTNAQFSSGKATLLKKIETRRQAAAGPTPLIEPEEPGPGADGAGPGKP
jgi:tetratricopeptide (TPR) repeat protein